MSAESLSVTKLHPTHTPYSIDFSNRVRPYLIAEVDGAIIS